MDQRLSVFLEAVVNEGRIAPVHVCVYAVLLHLQMKQGSVNPVTVFSRDAMQMSKILSRYTYLKCIRELSELGYIRIEPSLKKNQPSKIYINKKVKDEC